MVQLPGGSDVIDANAEAAETKQTAHNKRPQSSEDKQEDGKARKSACISLEDKQ